LSLLSEFEVIPWSRQLLARYVEVRRTAYAAWRQGVARKIDAADGWIAATALEMNRPLVTHDDKLSKSPLNQIITELRD
ncbi:MAG: type II toxin-antitoxin system VapC family toxin, partial [Chloroflexi bacterium]|nr:type II toxin-antitoxin system VapC family toxin [Chloroflexota bacterium]